MSDRKKRDTDGDWRVALASPFRFVARRPRLAALVDGSAILIFGVLTSSTSTLLEKHSLISAEFLASAQFIWLALLGLAYILLKIFTVREIESTFDFDLYVEQRIAPTYADKIADAIESGDSSLIVNLSDAVKRAINRKKR